MLFSRFLNLVVDICYDPLDGGSARSKFSYTDKNTHTHKFAATIPVCEQYTGVHIQAQGHATGVLPSPDYVSMPFDSVVISTSRSANPQLLLRFPTKLFHFLQVTAWHMRFLCWIPNATNTHAEYKILIAFQLQQ